MLSSVFLWEIVKSFLLNIIDLKFFLFLDLGSESGRQESKGKKKKMSHVEENTKQAETPQPMKSSHSQELVFKSAVVSLPKISR